MAWTNQDAFEREMRAAVVRATGEGSKATRKVAMAITQTLVDETPVDTGRTRGNWTVSHGSASGRTTERVDKPGARTKAAANEAISKFRPGVPMFIENNLEHVSLLNDGTSRQAPRNFVDTAIKAGESAAREAEREFKV